MSNSLSDQVVARLRTLVPLWWGAFVTWALAQWPDVGRTLTDFGVNLSDPQVVAAVTGASVIVFTFLWDYVWKRVEHILPAWLTRLVVGSNKTPTYAPLVSNVASPTDVATITSLPAPEQVGAGDVPDDAEGDDDTSNDEPAEPTDGTGVISDPAVTNPSPDFTPDA